MLTRHWPGMEHTIDYPAAGGTRSLFIVAIRNPAIAVPSIGFGVSGPEGIMFMAPRHGTAFSRHDPNPTLIRQAKHRGADDAYREALIEPATPVSGAANQTPRPRHIAQSAPVRNSDRGESATPLGACAREPVSSCAIGADRGFRTLVPGCGLRRVVPFGPLRPVLASQLVHPERLRNGHRVACNVQLFEATAPQPLETLARAVGANSAGPTLQYLSEDIARALGLLPWLRPVADHDPDPGFARPGDRFLCLRVANDPTRDGDTSDAVAPAAPAPAPRALKTRVPERFQQPWAWRLSREEVLYEMTTKPSLRQRLSLATARVRRLLGNAREWRRWSALLAGKSGDEQLWAVQPPRDALTDPQVRAWAQATLTAAGYDRDSMLREWEIYWRRKLG